MGTVRDPDFWRRFSRAVHPDEAEKYEKAQADAEKAARPGIKHSYVSPSTRTHRSTSSPSRKSTSSITTPPTPTRISPAARARGSQWPLTTAATSQISIHQAEEKRLEMQQPYSPSTIADMKSPMSPMSTTAPSDNYHLLDLKPPGPSTPEPASPTRPPRAFTRHANSSALTLGFSGRPASRFKFWTQISSDPSNRDSWLESQRKKKSQRTWMCWVFWLSLLGLIAGVVVCVLFLRARKII